MMQQKDPKELIQRTLKDQNLLSTNKTRVCLFTLFILLSDERKCQNQTLFGDTLLSFEILHKSIVSVLFSLLKASLKITKIMKFCTGQPLTGGARRHQLFPSNYTTCFNLVKIICKALLVILGFGMKSNPDT